MKNLLGFLLRYGTWMLFAFYVLVSCWLLFRTNPWQQHVYLTSASSVSGAVYGVSSQVTGYFGLRDINDDLQRRNALLQLELLHARQQLDELKLQLHQSDSLRLNDSILSHSRYSFIVAKVINNSVNRPHNYITISKGSLDGIKPEMGVIDRNGVVGIVNLVGPHTARVISLLNPYLRLSCKVKGSEHVGSLQWDGKSPLQAVLGELPRHARFHKGDTIVTSGFSTAFPEGVPVGTVVGSVKERDDNFFALKVNLFTDFSTLATVEVVNDRMADEIRAVEQDITEAANSMD